MNRRGDTAAHTGTMSVYFECETRTSMDRDKLYDLARSIDAHRESMAQSKEEAVAGITSGLISLGEQVTWKAWHFGFPIRMTSRVTKMDPPSCFADEQVKGPFHYFKHTHEFRTDGDCTVMTDRIEFAAPFGLIGRAVEAAFLARYMRRLIEIRNSYLVSQ